MKSLYKPRNQLSGERILIKTRKVNPIRIVKGDISNLALPIIKITWESKHRTVRLKLRNGTLTLWQLRISPSPKLRFNTTRELLPFVRYWILNVMASTLLT